MDFDELGKVFEPGPPTVGVLSVCIIPSPDLKDTKMKKIYKLKSNRYLGK